MPPDLATIVDRYVGRPWGPAFDCWALVRAIYADAYAIELPQLDHDAGNVQSTMPSCAGEITSGRWQLVDQPIDGDVLAMGRRQHPHHCGVWIAACGRVLHNDGPIGVSLAALRALTASGWGSFRWYRHRDRMTK